MSNRSSSVLFGILLSDCPPFTQWLSHPRVALKISAAIALKIRENPRLLVLSLVEVSASHSSASYLSPNSPASTSPKARIKSSLFRITVELRTPEPIETTSSSNTLSSTRTRIGPGNPNGETAPSS